MAGDDGLLCVFLWEIHDKSPRAGGEADAAFGSGESFHMRLSRRVRGPNPQPHAVYTTGKGDVQSHSENATGHRVQLSVRCSDRCLIGQARIRLVRLLRQSAVLDRDMRS